MEYLCTCNVTQEDKFSNITILESLDELNRVVINDKNSHVIMRDDFIKSCLPFNTLKEYIKNINKVNPGITIDTEGDYIDDLVDESFLKTLADNLNPDDLTMLLQFKPTETIDAIYRLIAKYNKQTFQELRSASIISAMREEIDTLKDDVKEYKEALEQERVNKVDVQNKLSVLVNRINYTHNVGVDASKLFKIQGNSYDNILYFKEISRVQYTDTFIMILQEIFKIIYNMPTRVLVIEGYYANGKVSQYPTLKPHYALTERDVLQSDILMLGYQPKIVQDIMKNPSNVSILIVLDRAGYSVPHILGDNVEYLYLASDIKDVPKDVPKSRIISYHSDTLFIPHIKGFEDMSPRDKVGAYSREKIVHLIVDLLE